jgi:hypothetical protein
MKKNKPGYVGSIILEAISIILAVLLGFIVNQWRENHNEKKRAEAAFQRILQEIGQNRAHLEEKQNYYLKMTGLLDSLMALPKPFHTPDMSTGWRGINPPVLSESAFQTASSTGVISSFDFHLAERISKIYSIQDDLQKLTTASLNSTITGDLNNYQSLSVTLIIYLELIRSWMGAAGSFEPERVRDLKENEIPGS